MCYHLAFGNFKILVKMDSLLHWIDQTKNLDTSVNWINDNKSSNKLLTKIKSKLNSTQKLDIYKKQQIITNLTIIHYIQNKQSIQSIGIQYSFIFIQNTSNIQSFSYKQTILKI